MCVHVLTLERFCVHVLALERFCVRVVSHGVVYMCGPLEGEVLSALLTEVHLLAH